MDNESAPGRKAANGEDSIYWDKSKGRYIGAVSLGYTPAGKRHRPKVSGKTKTEVRRKLRDLKRELEQGSRTLANYTVEQAVDDWLAQGLRGRADGSVYTYRSLARTHITPEIGRTKLKSLEADDVDTWLDGRAELIATASLKLLLSVLRRSIAHAQRRGRVVRNVADYVVAPEGRPGRPSKSLSLSQAESILRAEAGTWIHAYVVLALLVGTRPEETRPLTWQHVRLDADGEEKPHVQVWRSVRRHGEMKTHKSRRSLAMPRHVVAVMKEYRDQQQAALEGSNRSLLPEDLVFPHPSGKLRTAQDVRRNFRGLLKEAGLPDPHSWTTRELRTSFVSLLSDHGLRIEDIARLVGHSGSSTTERVYRKQLRPVIEAGAEAMDEIFSDKDGAAGP
ncbi:site-specific integrase [Streptomyces sp. MB09-01]|uniref:site-specific integrase n=1 Tax=Streptomyces sp. MB09-01 TaxID=3028666 RepID=UPI0029B3942F|nr:site-specific integrase [Streptomyces sp. MB09-01]MDX3540901.1 site-specific integrase [Streptomyces sp. MB09-01]